MATLYTPRIVTNGLVLCLDAGNSKSYPGTGTTWTDLSRNNNGTLTGPTFSSASRGSFVFDGINDRVDLGTNFSTYLTQSNSFTIECFVYPESTQAQYADIWGNHTDNVTGIVLQQNSITNNNYNWGFGNGTNWATSAATSLFNLTALTWNHLVAIRNSNTLFTYINGIKITQDSANNQILAPNTSFNFQIGTGYNLNGTRYFKGNISSFRIYSRALSESEVLQNFNATKGRYNL